MSKKIKILTPDNVEVEYTLASLGLRAAAAGIDLLIQGIAFLIIGSIGGIIIWKGNLETEQIYWAIGLLIFVYGMIGYLYYIISDIVMKGQTIGKKIYHIRIIRENGEGITFIHAIIREFLRTTVDILCVGTIMVFFTKKSKRLGDLLASTIVVEEQKVELYTLEDLGSNNKKYDLTKKERELLKDYMIRKDIINEASKESLKTKLINYFMDKYEIPQEEIYNKEEFLKELL